MSMLYKLARSILFQMDPETAHGLIMSNIDWASAARLTRLVAGLPKSDPVKVMGITFPNTIGLAAGMDKTGGHVSGLGRLGFGHIETGTFTPVGQPGNPRPRCWRLIPKEGVVNYMGFNNPGVEAGMANIARSSQGYRANGGIVGVNIGKQTATPVEKSLPDYLGLIEKSYTTADYLAIDISCPNVSNLTVLQEGDYLDELVRGMAEKRKEMADKHGRYVPITVKIGPDLTDDAIRRAADVFVKYGMDGITATNTTSSRKGVEGEPKSENPGGLSGRPLFERSTAVVQLLSDHLQGTLPIIASGGVMTPEHAIAKMEAGASLVQIYTGFIYYGPELIQTASDAIAAWRKENGR